MLPRKKHHKGFRRDGISRARKPILYRKPPPESHRALRDELDSLFRQYILERDGYQCVTTGCTDRQMLTCSHIFGRVNESARWSPLNAVCQTKAENEAHNHNKQPLFDYFISKFGKPMFDDLYIKWGTVEKLSYVELVNLRDEYRAALGKESVAA